MNRTRIKFCGLTRAADVRAAAGLGADYIGLVLAAGSPRSLALEQAAELAAVARTASADPPRVVLLVRDATAAQVTAAVRAVTPDLLQFHGSEGDDFCAGFGLPFWKALGMVGGEFSESHPSAAALLLDAHVPGGAGGTGERFDWSRWPRSARPLVLAGGLSPENVERAVLATRPFAVDVSSGIEAAPGRKDAGRMATFVEAVRRADLAARD